MTDFSTHSQAGQYYLEATVHNNEPSSFSKPIFIHPETKMLQTYCLMHNARAQ